MSKIISEKDLSKAFQYSKITTLSPNFIIQTITKLVNEQMISAYQCYFPPNLVSQSVPQSNSNIFGFYFISSSCIPFVQVHWTFMISKNSFLHLRVTFQTARYLGFVFSVKDATAYIQASKYLAYLNQGLTCYGYRFIMSRQGQISIQNNQFYINPKRLYSQLKQTMAFISIQINNTLPSLLAFIPQFQIYVHMYFHNLKRRNSSLSTDKLYALRYYSYEENKINNQNSINMNRQNSHNNKIMAYMQPYFIQKQQLKVIQKEVVDVLSLYGHSQVNKSQNRERHKQQIARDRAKFKNSNGQTQEQQCFLLSKRITISKGIIIQKRPQNKDLRLLGEGNFAQIKAGLFDFILQFSQNQSVIKSYSLQQGEAFRRAYLAQKQAKTDSYLKEESLQNQIKMISYLRNQYCQFIGEYLIDINDKQSLYMPLYQQSLFGLLKKARQQKIILSTEAKLVILRGIVEGVQFLRSRSILHRDLKPGNILLSKRLSPKIIDFGSSCFFYNSRNQNAKNIKLFSTEGYYIEYIDLPIQIKQFYLRQQYEQHPNFDIYSIHKIIQRTFGPQFSKGGRGTQQLKFIIAHCKQKNPQSRADTFHIIKTIDLLIGLMSEK